MGLGEPAVATGNERMSIVVEAPVSAWIAAFLPVAGLLVAEGRPDSEERRRVATRTPIENPRTARER